MTILVTGGAGYIGSHMVLGLLDRGEDVVVLDDLSTGFRWAVAPDAVFVEGDFADTRLVGELLSAHRIDSIAHFGGSLLVAESMRDPLAYYANNVAGTLNLLRAVVAAGVRHFVFSSSAAVYGTAHEDPVTETAPTRPISPYGRSKLMGETMIADAGRAHGLRYAALRYFNVAGADPAGRSGESTHNSTHLIKIAVEAARGKRDKMTIFGTDYPTQDGTAIRDYVHVSDLVEAHLAALDRLRAGADPIVANVGYGRGYSVREVLDAVERVVGSRLPVCEGERREGDPARIVADPARLMAITDWRPKRADLDLIVADAYRWEGALSGREGSSG